MFKKLKGLFIEDDGDNQKINKQTKPKNEDVLTEKDLKNLDSKPVQNNKNEAPYKAPSDAKPSEKFINKLMQALEENNQDGFDYLEYKQSLQSLTQMDMSEENKFKSSLAMASTMGSSPKKILDSAQFYVNILQKEESKFKDAFQAQQDRQISSKKEQLNNIQKSILQKEAQIKKLQQEIEDSKKQLDNSKNIIKETMQKVESTKNGFYAAYGIIVDQIKADIDKIKQFSA